MSYIELNKIIDDNYLISDGRVHTNKIKKNSHLVSSIIDATDWYAETFPIKLSDRLSLIRKNLTSHNTCNGCECVIPYRLKRATTENHKMFCSKKCQIEHHHFKDDTWKENLKIYYMKKHGVKHALQVKEFREKGKKTLLKKYGVDVPAKSAKIRKRMRQTSLERYGAEHAIQLDEIKNKIRSTNLKKYGVTCTLQNDTIKEKSKLTVREKYGVDHISQHPDFRKKVKLTNLRKYGVEVPLQSKEIMDRVKKTNLERYGTEYASQSEKVKNKIKQTRLSNRIGLKLIKDQEQYLIDMYQNSKLSVKEICKKIKGKYDVDISQTAALNYLHRNNIPIRRNRSSLEIKIEKFLDSIDISYQTNVRGLMPNKRLEFDVYITENKLAIECNGNYWHSDKFRINKNSHLEKLENAKKSGINLISFWEHEINDKFPIVQSIIKNRLGLSNKIYARRCTIVQPNKKTVYQFLDNNHIKGSIGYRIAIGLEYDGKLVQVMTFGKPRFNKHHQWELIRLASKIGYSVIGGSSRLYSSFLKTNPKSVISYCNRMKFDGDIYNELGFKFSHHTHPSYFYCNSYGQRLSRYQMQKHKMQELLESFDPNLSEFENANHNGFHRVYDCGQGVWKHDVSS